LKQLLLDTHALLWWLADDPALGAAARSEIMNPRNDVYVSAVTTWEISIKKALGKLKAPGDVSGVIEKEHFRSLPILLRHGEIAGLLPPLHRDPFDRMLVAQAQAEGLVIVTRDTNIPRYNVQVLPADA